jgi:hypothetical protein
MPTRFCKSLALMLSTGYPRLYDVAIVACSYLGSRPDSAMKDRITNLVKLKGESLLAMITLSDTQLIR